MLFVISAPSGAGKTTIVRRILENNPELVFSVSATSRPKRSGEVEGEDYFFMTKQEFEDRIDDDDLVEYEKLFNDHYYGTLKTFVDDVIQSGKDLIFDIDVKGALSLKNIYGDKSVLIFVKPPNKEVLRERLTNRGTEPNDHIEERLKRIDLEMEKGKEFDYQVINDNLETAVNEVEEIIHKFKK